MSLVIQPNDLLPPWERRAESAGEGVGKRLASFAGPKVGTPLPTGFAPGPARQARQERTRALPSYSAPTDLATSWDDDYTNFVAPGLGLEAWDQYRWTDPKIYKKRTGVGAIWRPGIGTPYTLSRIVLGEIEAAGGYYYDPSAGPGAWRYNGALGTPDTITVWTKDGEGFPSPVCDPDSYTTSSTGPYGDVVSPDFASAFWEATTATIATLALPAGYDRDSLPWSDYFWWQLYCEDTGATITLSEPVTWADLAAYDVSDPTQRLGMNAGNVNIRFSGCAFSTGTGGSDGTKWMVRQLMRYRVYNPHPEPRTLIWRETLRRNGLAGGAAWTSSLIQEENLDLIARPYLDEWGAWAPGDYAWEAVRTKLWLWSPRSYLTDYVENGLGGLAGSTASPQFWLFDRRGFGAAGPSGAGAFPPWVTEIRFRCTHPNAATVLERLFTFPIPSYTPGQTLTHRALTNGLTAPLVYDASLLTPQGAAVIGESLAYTAAGAVIPGAKVEILYRQRRRCNAATPGWMPFKVGSAIIPPHTWYARRRYTQEQGYDHTGPGVDADETYSSSATRRIVAERVWSLDGERGPLAVLEQSGEPADTRAYDGLFVEPNDEDNLTGAPISGVTAVLYQVTGTVPTSPRLDRVVDYDWPANEKPIVSETVITEEDVPAMGYGIWRLLEAPRGHNLRPERIA